jgi:hypothetical protein
MQLVMHYSPPIGFLFPIMRDMIGALVPNYFVRQDIHVVDSIHIDKVLLLIFVFDMRLVKVTMFRSFENSLSNASHPYPSTNIF